MVHVMVQQGFRMASSYIHISVCQYYPQLFYAPGSNDRDILFLPSLFVCMSVCLLSTLNFAITFEP